MSLRQDQQPALEQQDFEGMPELKWTWGYPLAIFLMIVAGAAPYLYFRRKGWLD